MSDTVLSGESKINWPDLVFYAEAEGMPYADVHVTTLRSHCAGQALEQLLRQQTTSVLEMDLTTEENRLKYQQILASMPAREYIEILEDRIVVAVDAEWIDDFAVDRALEMLETVDEFTVGTYYQFGSPIQYSYRQVDDEWQIL